MTLYLVNKTGGLLGCCSKGVDGWRFIPQVAAHKPSRKAWPTAFASLPRWAFDASNDLLTQDEWNRVKAA